MMHPYWRAVTDPDNLVATKLNGLPKYVVSTTLTDPVWEQTTVISTAVVEAVTRLKDSGEGELQVHGSCGLAKTLQEAGLVDEYRLLVFPVLVGAGKRLFSDRAAPIGAAPGRVEGHQHRRRLLRARPRAVRRRAGRSGGRPRGGGGLRPRSRNDAAASAALDVQPYGEANPLPPGEPL